MKTVARPKDRPKGGPRQPRAPAAGGSAEGRAHPRHNLQDTRPTRVGLAQGTGIVQYYLAASISTLAFLVYLASLGNGFVHWDDPDYVVDNRHIRSLDTALVRWAFFDFHASNWHPLTWLSHAFDYALWGLNPLGHHLTNNTLHAANTFVVVLLIVRLLRIYRDTTRSEGKATVFQERGSRIAAGVTGLLFGLSPVHVESVAWVAERKDLLCALFYLLSIMAYTGVAGCGQMEVGAKHEMRHGSIFINRHYLAALGLFVLALLSKPMAVSLPAVLLILDWFPCRRIQSLKSLRSAFVEKLPFLALSLTSSVLTVLAQESAIVKFLPLSIRLAVGTKALMTYLWKMVLPVTLIPYYPYPTNPSLMSLHYLLSLLGVTGLTLLCLVTSRKQKLWATVWSYYVITLFPVLGIVQVGGQALADRYTYLPSLGPFLVLGLLSALASMKTDSVQERTLLSKHRACMAAIVVSLLLMACGTVHQIGIWKDDFTLWNHVIEKQDVGIPFAHYNRGLAFRDLGRMDLALDDFNRAIALDSSDYRAFIDRGYVYGEMGQVDRAIDDFNRAIAVNPRCYQAYTNKGMVYGKMGMLNKAIEQFDKAIDINPESWIDYGNRGLAYLSIGQDARALEDLNKALELDETYSEAYGTRGNVYLKRGDERLAIAEFQKACDLGNKKGCDVLKVFRK